MAKELQSIADVVEVLGGAHAVMALTKTTSSSVVPVWKHRKKFPSYTYPAIQRALKAKGAYAPDELWNLERT
jgi:DNA-binding transcriptional regulator YdaS (Cro superfamily)